MIFHVGERKREGDKISLFWRDCQCVSTYSEVTDGKQWFGLWLTQNIKSLIRWKLQEDGCVMGHLAISRCVKKKPHTVSGAFTYTCAGLAWESSPVGCSWQEVTAAHLEAGQAHFGSARHSQKCQWKSPKGPKQYSCDSVFHVTWVNGIYNMARLRFLERGIIIRVA